MIVKNSYVSLKEIRIISENLFGERQVFHLLFMSAGTIFQYIDMLDIQESEDPAVKTIHMEYDDALRYYYGPSAIRRNVLDELRDLFRPGGREVDDGPIEFQGMASLFGWGKDDGGF